jgi:hypothetical protein
MLLIWYSPGLRRYDGLYAQLSVNMHCIDDNSSVYKGMEHDDSDDDDFDEHIDPSLSTDN